MADFVVFDPMEEVRKALSVPEGTSGVQSVDWDKVKVVFKKFGEWLLTQTKNLMVWVGEILHEHRAEIMIALKDVALETIRDAMDDPNWGIMTSAARRDLIYALLVEKIKAAGISLGGHIISEEIGIPPELEDDIRLVIELAMAVLRDGK